MSGTTSQPGEMPQPGGRRFRVTPDAAMLALWCLGVVAVSAQGAAAHVNNFAIFRGSWENLAAGRDLYALSAAYHDQFKYSPTIALLFAPFALLPFGPGLLAWNALNAGVLYVALGRLLAPRAALAARALVFLDMFGSMQNAQSNALVAGLIVLAFTGLEARRQVRAAWSVALGAAIKIFPATAGLFLVFHPRRWRFVALCAGAGAVLVALPLVVVAPADLVEQYRSWRAVQAADAELRWHSIMQHVHLALGVDWPNWPQQLAGASVLLAPLAVRRGRWAEPAFRRLVLASLLVFCVVFNHRAESPSFVIATTGVAIWFLTVERTPAAWLVLAFVVVGTTLSKSELFPQVVQREFIDRYYFKTIPCFVAWIAIQRALWRAGFQPATGSATRADTGVPVNVEPVVPVSSTSR